MQLTTPLAIKNALACFLFLLTLATALGGQRFAILQDQIPGLDPALVERVTTLLQGEGFAVTPLTCDQLCDPHTLTVQRFDGLVLTSSPQFPMAAEQPLLAFLRGGGCGIFMGGFAFHEPLWQLQGRWLTTAQIEALPLNIMRPVGFTPSREFGFYAAFEDYEVYRLADVSAVVPCSRQPWFPWQFKLSGRFEGLSALGFQFHNESTFVPLLSAVDHFGRTRGWAAGLHINYAGPFKGSTWALFGITTPAFYRTPEFEQVLKDVAKRLATRACERWAADENKKELVHAVSAVATPPPLRLDKGQAAFVRADGRPVFLIGCNYIGGLHCKYSADNPAEVEADFQRMQRAGINAVRIYAAGRFLTGSGAALLKACARKYGVYFMPVVVDHPDKGDEPELRAQARKMAEVFKDEPMLLGYDLMNEPYFWEVGKMKNREGKTLHSLNPLPPNGWKSYDAAFALHSQGTVFQGVSGKLPYPTDPAQRQAFDGIDRLYGSVIGWLRAAIREVDPTVPITVGYNTIWSCMPANAPLDFVAAHFYEPPAKLESVKHNLTAFDRLRLVWPDRPICAGEFGYSGGDRVDGKVLDVHTIAVGEFAHYLYAFAHGYAGVMKWALTDSSRWTDHRQVVWIPREERAKHLEQARFGMFYENGTLEGGAKPLVPALNFLREYAEAGHRGGRFDLRAARTPIHTGYVYENTDALFVGDVAYESPRLCFQAPQPANVLVWWQDGAVRLLTTADATVRLNVRALVPELVLTQLRIDGQRGKTSVEGDQVVLETLEAETITIR